MTAMASHRLQEAVFAALTEDETLSALLSGIYDEVPVAAKYPYVAMGDTNIRPADLKDINGAQISFDLTIWSNEPSQMQVKELLAATDQVIDKAALQLIGYDLVRLRLQNAGVVRQWSEHGSLYRGRLTYSALVYEK